MSLTNSSGIRMAAMALENASAAPKISEMHTMPTQIQVNAMKNPRPFPIMLRFLMPFVEKILRIFAAHRYFGSGNALKNRDICEFSAVGAASERTLLSGCSCA